MVAHTVYRTIETKRKQTKRTRGDDDDNDDDARGGRGGEEGRTSVGTSTQLRRWRVALPTGRDPTCSLVPGSGRQPRLKGVYAHSPLSLPPSLSLSYPSVRLSGEGWGMDEF